MENIKILVVDDESRMRKAGKGLPCEEGYMVLEAGTAWRRWIFSMRIKTSRSLSWM